MTIALSAGAEAADLESDTGLSPAAAIAMPAGTGSFSFTGVPVTADKTTAVLARSRGASPLCPRFQSKPVRMGAS